MNSACFPVQYQETYYKNVVDGKNEDLCKFAYWNGYVVGAACSRVETVEGSDRQRLYIMTLCVLAAYRGRGIGTQLIESIMDYYEAQKDSSLSKVDEIALHVQISNEDAMNFYKTRFGFEKGEMVENYYRRIDPPHCHRLFKKVR